MKNRRILFAALIAAFLAAAGFAICQERVLRISGDDAEEMMMMVQGPEEGPGMMGGPGGCCGMMCRDPQMRPCCFFMGMEKELGLTGEQVKKLKEMWIADEKRAIDDRAKLKIMGVELNGLLTEDDVDVKAVDGKIDGMSNLKAKMHKDRIHGMLDAKKVLTPEQREKLKEMKGPGMGMGIMKKRIECKKMIGE